MPKLSTAPITSVRSLSQRQKEFISSGGPDPRNRDAVVGFAREFRREFGGEMPWRNMRRLITKARRKKRREGSNNANKNPPQPHVRLPYAILGASNYLPSALRG